MQNDPLAARNIFKRAQLQALVKTAPAPVVEDLLMEGTVNLLVGDSGLGKTPLLEQLAICVATGSPFLGLDTQKGKVLFCDAESAGSHFVGYIRALEDFLGASPSEDMIHYFLANVGAAEMTPVSEFETVVADMVRDVGPKLVIIDCLRPFWPDAELKSDIAARILKNLRKIATEGACAIVIVHHRRKEARLQKGMEAPNLETNHRDWLNEAAGTRALINQTDCRLGIDLAKGAGEAYAEETYCIAGFSKHEGDILPTYFTRVYTPEGKPRGYAPAMPGLTSQQAAVFNKLPSPYSFSDVFALQGGKSKKTASLWMKLFVQGHLVTPKGAGSKKHYIKEVDYVDATV
jgi:predicted ATPase